MDLLTRYRDMNSSAEGTASPTSFSIVLYCDSSLVHAGEYLLKSEVQRIDNVKGTYSTAVTESRIYALSR